MEKGITIQALKKSQTLWPMKGSSVHNVLLLSWRRWVRPKDGSGDSWFTDWGHSESTLGPKGSMVWWAAFQALEWPQSPALAPHMSPEDRTQRALFWAKGQIHPQKWFSWGRVNNFESMAKHREISLGTGRGGRRAFGSIGLWSYYLRLRLLSDGGQMPCNGHANIPRGLALPGSCPFMLAPMALFSSCLSIQAWKMKSRLKDVWDFSYWLTLSGLGRHGVWDKHSSLLGKARSTPVSSNSPRLPCDLHLRLPGL